MSCILRQTHIGYMQDVFNYAAPVLVGMESVCVAIGNPSAIWLQTLETTRILLAHCSQSDCANIELKYVMALNMRNLYRLYGMDLSEKEHWANIIGESARYMPRINNKPIWVHKNRVIALEILEVISFNNLKENFDNDTENDEAKHAFGRALFLLVASSDGKWKGQVMKWST